MGEWTKVSTKAWTENNLNSVCRQLKCGDHRYAARAERFSLGSGAVFPKMVDCKTRTSPISECIKDSIPDQRDGDAVGVTCEGKLDFIICHNKTNSNIHINLCELDTSFSFCFSDHMVVFLNGSTSCSGLVGIEQGSKTYWLSGSKETWTNDTASLVCRQKQCGALKDFGFVSNADMKKDVWEKSLKCSTEHKSLFECEENKTASDHKATIARVTCSGNVRHCLHLDCDRIIWILCYSICLCYMYAKCQMYCGRERNLFHLRCDNRRHHSRAVQRMLGVRQRLHGQPVGRRVRRCLDRSQVTDAV